MSKLSKWRGKDVEKMTKAELIQALNEMSQLYEQNTHEHIRQLQVLRGSKV